MRHLCDMTLHIFIYNPAIMNFMLDVASHAAFSFNRREFQPVAESHRLHYDLHRRGKIRLHRQQNQMMKS